MAFWKKKQQYSTTVVVTTLLTGDDNAYERFWVLTAPEAEAVSSIKWLLHKYTGSLVEIAVDHFVPVNRIDSMQVSVRGASHG